MAIDLKRIRDIGMRRVLVTTLQPVGCLPRQTASSSYKQCNDTENLASTYHNALLEEVVTTLNNSTKDSSFLILDTNSVFEKILTNETNLRGMQYSLLTIDSFHLFLD